MSVPVPSLVVGLTPSFLFIWETALAQEASVAGPRATSMHRPGLSELPSRFPGNGVRGFCVCYGDTECRGSSADRSTMLEEIPLMATGEGHPHCGTVFKITN